MTTKLNKNEFYAKYGDAKVKFSGYYKYTFYYDAVLPNGLRLVVWYGGDSELDYIIPDGCIDKETAEYFVKLHENRLNNIYEMNKERRCNYCYRTVDSYFYNYSCKFCYDKGLI